MKNVKHKVVVENPLRIDFAGGWSDTPPICHEMGVCIQCSGDAQRR